MPAAAAAVAVDRGAPTNWLLLTAALSPLARLAPLQDTHGFAFMHACLLAVLFFLSNICTTAGFALRQLAPLRGGGAVLVQTPRLGIECV